MHSHKWQGAQTSAEWSAGTEQTPLQPHGSRIHEWASVLCRLCCFHDICWQQQTASPPPGGVLYFCQTVRFRWKRQRLENQKQPLKTQVNPFFSLPPSCHNTWEGFAEAVKLLKRPQSSTTTAAGNLFPSWHYFFPFSAVRPECWEWSYLQAASGAAAWSVGWWIHFNLLSLALTSGAVGQDISPIAYPERSII